MANKMNLDKYDIYFCIGANEDTGDTTICANGDLNELTACIAILTEYLAEQFGIEWKEVLDVCKETLKEESHWNEPNLIQ